MRRIVLIGSECTGKTELTEWLAGELQVPWSEEHARAYADAHGGGASLGAADVDPIARGQLALEDRAIAAAAAASAPLVLHDTDLLGTVVYATAYYGAASVPPWLPAAVAARVPDLYLLCDVDVPWEDDAARDPAADREAMQARFVDAVHRSGAASVTLRGNREARRAAALAAIRRADPGQNPARSVR